jgi:hypothetical protein
MAKRESASRKKSASSKTTAKKSTGARVRDATKSQVRIKNKKISTVAAACYWQF